MNATTIAFFQGKADPCGNWHPERGARRGISSRKQGAFDPQQFDELDSTTTMAYAALVKLTGLDSLKSSGTQQQDIDNTAAFTIDELAEFLTMLAARTQPQPVLPTYSGNRCENMNAFLNDMAQHVVSYSIPEDQRLTTLAKQLRGEAAKFWADYKDFDSEYDVF
ncbi:hypothetical protein FQA39_LY01076 [Lamprigera yunnana]|nr:hypothetical protein FQA39_LY01076 [Lamprigera yunnana]